MVNFNEENRISVKKEVIFWILYIPAGFLLGFFLARFIICRGSDAGICILFSLISFYIFWVGIAFFLLVTRGIIIKNWLKILFLIIGAGLIGWAIFSFLLIF